MNLVFEVTKDLTGDFSFAAMQEAFSQHGRKLNQTVALENELGVLFSSNMESSLKQSSPNESEFYSLTDKGVGGDPRAFYLNLCIEELKNGQSWAPLAYSALWLNYLKIFPFSDDGKICGAFLTSDLLHAVRVGFALNVVNVMLADDTIKTEEEPPLEFVTDLAEQQYSNVSIL